MNAIVDALPVAEAEEAHNTPIRRLRVDLSKGFPKLWNGGDAFRTHHMNALSMSFPSGEQFFIEAVKLGVSTLSPEKQATWAKAIRGFTGQEATHRFLHTKYNAELERQGLKNIWKKWAEARIRKTMDKMTPLDAVAITAAYEHFTSVMSTGLLTHPHWLDGADPEVALIWRWHSVEETEHKAVAMDVYRDMGGTEGHRIRWFLYVATTLYIEWGAQSFLNLWNSGHLLKPRTWWQALKFMCFPGGVIGALTVPMLRYMKPGFHPTDLEDAAEAAVWLQEQKARYSIIG